MEQNPFSARLILDFFEEDPCDSLDVYITELKEVGRRAWHFNPPHHRIVNWLVNLFVHTRKNEWSEYAPHEYVGIERRNKARDCWDEYFTHIKRSVAVGMMPKTKKIEQLKDVA